MIKKTTEGEVIGVARKTKKKANSAVVFLSVFILSCVLFGGMLFYGLYTMQQDAPDTDGETENSSPTATSSFTEQDARNLLIVTTDKEQARGFTVVRTDPANARVRTLALPKELVIATESGEQRLCDAYDSLSFAALQQAIAETLDIPLHHYAILSYEDIEALISYLGEGVVFTLHEDLNYRSEDGSYSLRLSGGERHLTALQVTAILRYPAWHDGLRQQANVQAELLAAIINRYMTPHRIQNGEAAFSQIINLVRSDIRISHFTAAKAGLDHLSSRNTDGTLAATVYVNGIYTGSGDEARFAIASHLPQEWKTVF